MKTKRHIFFALLCIAIFMNASIIASAEKDSFHLNETSLKLQVGNTYYLYLEDSGNTDESFYWFYYYPCTWSSSNTEVALVEDGNVTIVGKGKATITAVYNGKKYTCKITVGESTYKLSKTELNTRTFTEEQLNITYNSDVSWYKYDVYRLSESAEETICYDAFSIYIDETTGTIDLKALKDGKYRIDFYACTYDEDTYQTQNFKASCMITVSLHGLIESRIGCALGTTRNLTFGDLSNIEFTIEDPTVASINTQGVISPIGLGSTSLTMNGYNAQGELETYECQIEVIRPRVICEKDYVQAGQYINIDISENSWNESPVFCSSDPEIIHVDNSSPYALKEGRAKLSVTVDVKKFTFTIDVINPRLKKDSFLMTSSSTAKLAVLGLNSTLKKEPVTYTVSNKKIASVAEDGTITAKKTGNTNR